MAKAGRKKIFRDPVRIGLGVERAKYRAYRRLVSPDSVQARLRAHIDADLGLCERPGEGGDR